MPAFDGGWGDGVGVEMSYARVLLADWGRLEGMVTALIRRSRSHG